MGDYSLTWDGGHFNHLRAVRELTTARSDGVRATAQTVTLGYIFATS
jgi:hypothetical protein